MKTSLDRLMEISDVTQISLREPRKMFLNDNPLDDSIGLSEEFVHLAKGNYLDKDGSIKEAQTMKDHLGNEYFMVAKDKLWK